MDVFKHQNEPASPLFPPALTHNQHSVTKIGHEEIKQKTSHQKRRSILV